MTTRRGFVGAGATALGIGLGALVRPRAARTATPVEPRLELIETPIEDLMTEHAVLERVLLIYEVAEATPAVIGQAAGIVRRYIEDHHERDEELHVFPRLERIGVERALIARLRAQHVAGRAMTDEIIECAGRGERAVAAMQRFVHMYRPHAARENTVVFPAFRTAVSRDENERLRETLERSERVAFGGEAFGPVLAEVETLERALGIT